MLISSHLSKLSKKSLNILNYITILREYISLWSIFPLPNLRIEFISLRNFIGYIEEEQLSLEQKAAAPKHGSSQALQS